MLVCIVSKRDYENTIINHKFGNSVEDLKYVCIGSINNIEEVYKITNALPCLTDIVIHTDVIPMCLILTNP